MSAPVTMTLTKPSVSGSTAAASEPKTTSRIRATIGKPPASALARSSFESSCIPAQTVGCPARYVVTPPLAMPGSRASRRSTAGSISSSGATALASGKRVRSLRCSCSSPRRATAGGRETPSTSAASRWTRSTAAARSEALAPGSARSSTAMPVASLTKTPCIESATAFDWLPGTSKPPPVRCSVWRAAKGSAQITMTTQIARTKRRRRPRTPASRFIPSRIGWLASLSQRRASVCESRHARLD